MLELILADHRSGRILAHIAADRSPERLREVAMRNLHLLQAPDEAFELRDARHETLDWARLVSDPQGQPLLLWGLAVAA